MRILCTADLHLGCRSSQIDVISNESHSSANAWRRIVNHACTNDVDIVVLSGDIIDRGMRHFESVGPIIEGVERLHRKGIPVIAVAGNHDWNLLGPLATRLREFGFTLLGQGGTWEGITVTTHKKESIRLVGWSFPDLHYTESPIIRHKEALNTARGDAQFTLGLLHCDYNIKDSRYASVSTDDIISSGVDLWVLGHTHSPLKSIQPAGPTVLYPGSPQALDPGRGERGSHGVFQIDINNMRSAVRPDMHITHIPLSSVRYEEIDIDLTGIKGQGDADVHVSDQVNAAVRNLTVEQPDLRVFSLRINLVGRLSNSRTIAANLMSAMQTAELRSMEYNGVAVSVNRVRNLTLPDYTDDRLESISMGVGAPASVAKLALQIRRGKQGVLPSQLSTEISAVLKQLNGKQYLKARVEEFKVDAADINRMLLQRCEYLLDTMLPDSSTATENR